MILTHLLYYVFKFTVKIFEDIKSLLYRYLTVLSLPFRNQDCQQFFYNFILLIVCILAIMWLIIRFNGFYFIYFGEEGLYKLNLEVNNLLYNFDSIRANESLYDIVNTRIEYLKENLDEDYILSSNDASFVNFRSLMSNK